MKMKTHMTANVEMPMNAMEKLGISSDSKPETT